jgi:nucleoside-diphosphate-sugar epimerase
MTAPRILVSGMSGLIGSALRTRLEGRFPLRALNRRDIPGVPCHRGDIGDLAAIEPAFRDIDVVVHLAAAAGGGEPWECPCSITIWSAPTMSSRPRAAPASNE